MKGKEHDLRLANKLREAFIKRYESNEREFEELINSLGDNCLERLIHRLKGEKEINIYRDYNALKKVAETVKTNYTKEVYKFILEIDDARAWINDNGKYIDLAFEALYHVFKKNEGLIPLIEKATTS